MPLMIKGFKKDVIKFAIITCRKPLEWWNGINGGKKFGYLVKPWVPPLYYLIGLWLFLDNRRRKMRKGDEVVIAYHDVGILILDIFVI